MPVSTTLTEMFSPEGPSLRELAVQALSSVEHGYDLLAPNIFSASQVARGKPAPDLFLFAAERMKAAPERCVVIEDSVPGVTGAHAAGMSVLGFHGGSHCPPGHAERLRAAGAGLTFDDMRQLPELVRRVEADALAG